MLMVFRPRMRANVDADILFKASLTPIRARVYVRYRAEGLGGCLTPVDRLTQRSWIHTVPFICGCFRQQIIAV